MMKSLIGGAKGPGLRSLYAAAVMVLLGGCGGGGTDGSGGEPPRVAGVTLVAGDATAVGSTDATGAAARFDAPSGIAIDSSGNLYVADWGNSTLRKITPSGQVSTLAGVAGFSQVLDGTGAAARFARPTGLTIDATGNLFVTDALFIRKVSPAGLVTTVASIPTGVNIDGRSTNLFAPGAVAVDTAGALYVTNGIGTRKVTASGTTMLEGVATQDNVFGTRTLIPRGITIDNSGTVYVRDLQGAISKAGPSGTLLPFAGAPGVVGSADGTGPAASFSNVAAMATDAKGNVFVADGSLVRKITPSAVVSTVAGKPGAAGLELGPLPASLAGVRGVAVDKNGDLFVTSGNAVVKISLPAP